MDEESERLRERKGEALAKREVYNGFLRFRFFFFFWFWFYCFMFYVLLLFFFNVVLTWKIVGVSKASILYIYRLRSMSILKCTNMIVKSN